MPKFCVIPGDGLGQEVFPAKAGWDWFLKHSVPIQEATLQAVTH